MLIRPEPRPFPLPIPQSLLSISIYPKSSVLGLGFSVGCITMASIVSSAAASGSASGERLEEDRLPPSSAPPPMKPKIGDEVRDKSKNLGYIYPDDIEEWEPERISDEDMERYRKQVKESGGYDVDYIPGGLCNLLISPVLNLETSYDFWAGHARIAVDYYNKDKEEDEKLVFLKLLKVNEEIGAFFAYLTFEVKDNAVVCQTKIYQAKVGYGPGYNKVKEFRKKPSQLTPSQKT